jgi:hypothetical protein
MAYMALFAVYVAFMDRIIQYINTL